MSVYLSTCSKNNSIVASLHRVTQLCQNEHADVTANSRCNKVQSPRIHHTIRNSQTEPSRPQFLGMIQRIINERLPLALGRLLAKSPFLPKHNQATCSVTSACAAAEPYQTGRGKRYTLHGVWQIDSKTVLEENPFKQFAQMWNNYTYRIMYVYCFKKTFGNPMQWLLA